MMSTKEVSPRPEKVTAAVRILYLLAAIGVVRTAMTVYRHVDVRSPYFFIGTKFLILVVVLVLIYQVSKGKNWARWLVLATIVISFPLSVLPNFDAFAHNPIHTMLGFLQLCLFLVAMVFLFRRKSSYWFGAGKHPGKDNDTHDSTY